MATKSTNKGFITDQAGNRLLPITRGELVLDSKGYLALASEDFLAGKFTDAKGNELPGLITAAERALLSGVSGNSGIKDIYDKLGFINNGLMFGGSIVHFYNTQGATPIQVVGDGNINITNSSNTVTIGLQTLLAKGIAESNILKSINVDTYGRVTSVTSGVLTDAEIPEELTGKKLTNAIISNGTTDSEDIGTDSKAIANKAYVDSKIGEMSGIATGALQFGGPIGSASEAAEALTDSRLSKNNYFYKITDSFELSTANFVDSNKYDGIAAVTVKAGDTLIVYKANSSTAAKYVYVPSGDEVITSLTVQRDNNQGVATDVITNQTGAVKLRFSNVFNVENNPSGSKIAYVTLPQASDTQDGYLGKSDYVEFKSYANAHKVVYTPTVTEESPNKYTIGTLAVGSTTHTIYGTNNISSFSLENAAEDDNTINPKLTFTESGSDPVYVGVQGGNGIEVRNNSGDIIISSTNKVANTSTNYLNITNNSEFSVKIGSYDGETLTQGLTDYSEFNTFKNSVYSSTTSFETISSKLTDQTKIEANNKNYYYGSADLLAAITCDII